MSRVVIYLDDETEKRLFDASIELGRTIEDLAESLVSEGALDWAKTKG